MVLYFNSIIISNQIEFYSAINREISAADTDSMTFTGITEFAKDPLSAMISCYWKSMYLELKEGKLMPGTWLLGASWWNVTVWNGSCKFAFMTGGAEIMNG